MLEQLILQTKQQNTKFIIVTGGVCSSIGKGVLISSIGVLIKGFGASVSVMKCDPYLNVDPGTMSPLVHGEVFVTSDGAETDLDLGHYERSIGIQLTRDSSLSAGQVFQEILTNEREGKFLGKCIQLVPHVVDTIKKKLLQLAVTTKANYILVEIGGTVGDIEGEVFLEALRQLRLDLPGHMMHCHLSYVPYLNWANEVKTKPTQHSVMLLKKAGLIPDALFLRTEQLLSEESLKKISLMCGVPYDMIFQNMTRKPIYQLFLDLQKQQLPEKIQKFFDITNIQASYLDTWKNLIEIIKKPKEKITIGLIAKYIGTSEPYISVIEAIKAAGYACNRDVDIIAIDAHALESKLSNNNLDSEYQKALELLTVVHGIIVPGGFDKRGCEGKIFAAQFAREKNIPYLGLCLGMQVMLIEAARNLLGIKNATSMEFDPHTKEPVITLLDEQNHVTDKGGTMRLGSYRCTLLKESKVQKAYGVDEVFERHRHRYEFNNSYKKQLEEKGVIFSGINTERNLVEIAELQDHPYMIGAQFHPEFISSPLKPHPLFIDFIKACREENK